MLSIRSALLSVLLLAISVGAQEVVPTAKQLQDATTAGTAAMQLQAEYSLGHAEELAAAIRGNNLTNATQWYRWSRDHYEQVEVLAYGFSDIDRYGSAWSFNLWKVYCCSQVRVACMQRY